MNTKNAPAARFPCVVCDAKGKSEKLDELLVAMLFTGATIDPAVIAAGLCGDHAALMDSVTAHVLATEAATAARRAP